MRRVQPSMTAPERADFRPRRDVLALLAVAAAIAAAILYRRYGVEPRAWTAACIARHPPLGCAPRAAALWLQGHGLWGWTALTAGLSAFATRRFPLVLTAIVVGGAAIVNYNAGLGMLGTALGAWTWLRLPPDSSLAPGTGEAPGRRAPRPPRSRSAPGG